MDSNKVLQMCSNPSEEELNTVGLNKLKYKLLLKYTPKFAGSRGQFESNKVTMCPNVNWTLVIPEVTQNLDKAEKFYEHMEMVKTRLKRD